MAFETTESALQSLESSPSIETPAFPIEFVSKLNGGIVRCLKADNKPYSVKSGESYDIHFIQPAYVATVEIEFSKSVLGASFELSILDGLSNRQVRKRLEQDSFSDKILFEVSCITSGITIHLQPSYIEMFGRRTLEIKKIEISGYTAADFESLDNSLTHLRGFREAAIEELVNEKTDIEARQLKVQQRENAVTQAEANKKAQLVTLEQSLEVANEAANEAAEKLSDIKEEISLSEARKQALADQVNAHQTTVRSIEAELSKGKEELRAMAVTTSEAERRLRELTNNVNLFSEEFSSFSDHGAKQARIFIALSIIPLAIVVALTVQLLMGAVDLSVKYIAEPNIDLLTIFVTRLPYLTVCGSILAVCYSAIKFLFSRISTIYAERLDFSKIGIIAKDVASASANGLSLQDDQLYEARTYLKIEMLKSYLSGNIGAFTYSKRGKTANVDTDTTAVPPITRTSDATESV